MNFTNNFTKQQGSGQEDGRDPVFSGGASEPGEEAQEAGQGQSQSQKMALACRQR